MAGKVVNSSSVLLSKFVTGGKESASKTATSHIRKTFKTFNIYKSLFSKRKYLHCFLSMPSAFSTQHCNLNTASAH